MSQLSKYGQNLLQSNGIQPILFRERSALFQGVGRHGQSKAQCDNRRVLHVNKCCMKERRTVKLNESDIRHQVKVVSLAKTRE